MEIREAKAHDIDFLVSLRNDPVSAAYSKRGLLSKEVIQSDYLENSLKKAFLVYRESTPIAYIIFEQLSQIATEISIALAPEFRGKGLGKKIIQKGTLFALFHLGYDTVWARIYEANTASICVFEKANYTLQSCDNTLRSYLYTPQSLSPLVVVFDFDGVIANSLESLYKVYHAFLDHFGIQGNREEFDKLNGPSLPEIVHYLQKRYNIKGTEEQLLAEYKKRIKEGYATTELNRGVAKTLDILRNAGARIALATSSRRESVTEILQKEKIYTYFDSIVTGDDVTKAKPSPEIYEKVKEHYPDHPLIVIEDSDNGILSAQKAGLTVISYGPTNKEQSAYHIKEFPNLMSLLLRKLFHYTVAFRGREITLQHVMTTSKADQEIEELVDAIWQKESQKSNLFNGCILAVEKYNISLKQLCIEAKTVEYKKFLANHLNPSLELHIKPIAVSGILIDNEGQTLIAQRGAVTEYPNLWELAPAGSIDAPDEEGGVIDFYTQIKKELHEETGIEEAYIDTITPFALIYDTAHQVYDICLELRINTPLIQILNRNSKEYQDFEIIPLTNVLPQLFSRKSTPTAKAFILNYINFLTP